MMPPIFAILDSSAVVRALLGAAPNMRLFPFGEASQNTPRPYATFQVVSGVPENYIGQHPDADSYRVQVDAWAETQVSANQLALAIRDAIEPHAYMVGSGSTTRDPETRAYRYMLDFEFKEYR